MCLNQKLNLGLFLVLLTLLIRTSEANNLSLCPDYLKPYANPKLEPPPFKILAVGLYKWKPINGNTHFINFLALTTFALEFVKTSSKSVQSQVGCGVQNHLDFIKKMYGLHRNF